MCVTRSQGGTYTVFSQRLFTALGVSGHFWWSCPAGDVASISPHPPQVLRAGTSQGDGGKGPGNSAVGVPLVLSWPWTELQKTPSLLAVGISFTSQTQPFLVSTCGKTHIVLHCSKRNLVTRFYLKQSPAWVVFLRLIFQGVHKVSKINVGTRLCVMVHTFNSHTLEAGRQIS